MRQNGGVVNSTAGDTHERTVVGLDLAKHAFQVALIEKKLLAWHSSCEASRRLAEIPGVGLITATAVVASVGNATQFRSARQFAAWLGLVPQQHSSGGKERLGHSSQPGDGLHQPPRLPCP